MVAQGEERDRDLWTWPWGGEVAGSSTAPSSTMFIINKIAFNSNTDLPFPSLVNSFFEYP